MERLYETIFDKFPTLFDEKAKNEIRTMLAPHKDNRYLTAVVMGPYIDGSDMADRDARSNYLVFMDEVNNAEGAFARKEDERPLDRLVWFYNGLTTDHPLYAMLQEGENGVRARKGIPEYDEAEAVVWSRYTDEQRGAYEEIEKMDNPVEGFWWSN